MWIRSGRSSKRPRTSSQEVLESISFGADVTEPLAVLGALAATDPVVAAASAAKKPRRFVDDMRSLS